MVSAGIILVLLSQIRGKHPFSQILRTFILCMDYLLYMVFLVSSGSVCLLYGCPIWECF